MSGAGRDRILAALRATARASAPSRTIARVVPARARGDHAALVTRFVEMADLAGASVARVADAAGAPGAVAGYLARNGLGEDLVLAGEPALSALPWHHAPRLLVHRRPPLPTDRVSVTGAVAGVAETGTVLVRSGAQVANALHVLAEAHIVVLDAGAIVGSYEEAWARLVAGGEVPRAATFITGPSRTADIEKTPQIGVHGPKGLHIVLIHDSEGLHRRGGAAT
jgi:L-lactate dehydrogenase complex protein LldG